MLVPFGLGSLEFASYTVRSVLTKPCYYILALLLSEVHMGVHMAWLGFYCLIFCLLLTSRAVEHVVDPGLLPILPWRTGSDHLSIFSPEYYTVSTPVQGP
jgi:hypothetical protein